jgi:hypothetical protein
MISGAIDQSTEKNAAAPKLGRDIVRGLIAIGALLLCLTLAPGARADSASCPAKVSSYVVELDELLAKERNWLTPYLDLNKRYFPFRDCEVDTLLEIVINSNFIRSISYGSRTKTYFIHFSSDEVLVGFAYHVSERKSETDTALWIHK